MGANGNDPNQQQQTDPNEGEGMQTDPNQQTDPNEGGTGTNEAGNGEGSNTGGNEPTKGDTVNRYKHEREVSKLQKQLDDLTAENARLKGENEGIAALNKRLDDMEAEAKANKVTESLKAAGCHDIKAACARLDEFDGDVEKLKAAAPYLFTSSDKSKSTGGNPKGKAGSGDEDEKLDKAFGLK